MRVYWNFPPGWYPVMILIYGSLFVLRKIRINKKVDDFRISLRFGIAALVIGFIIEFVGFILKLWLFIPGSWPITMWISYFGVGLLIFESNEYLKEKKKIK